MHIKVDKRIFYLLNINLLFLHEKLGIKKVCEFGSFLDFDMVNSLSILYWAVLFSHVPLRIHNCRPTS